ncbi:GRAM domain-containing protein 1B-like [Popillia japonica]|uniref:GRAM domain-containing protein 1B-like n=1 Tax=Popillia japonica TaxID=7064 RepID=A0AAW1K350_POPJA
MFYAEPAETDSEEDNSAAPRCTCPHDGKLLIDEIYSVHIDELFTMLFTNSQFFMDLQDMRKATNVQPGPWCDERDGTKTRVVTLTIPLTQTIGPKSADVVESQTMLSCSEPGLLYSIDSKVENKGIPYADRFYITIHFCMLKCSDQKTSLEVYADVKYTQKVWGFVKSIIDKNTWQGLHDVYTSLKQELRNVIDENANAPHKRKIKNRRKSRSSPHKEDAVAAREKVKTLQADFSLLIILGLLVILLLVNVYLFYRIWTLEHSIASEPESFCDIGVKTSIDYQSLINKLLSKDYVPSNEIDNWFESIIATIKYLKKAEESLQYVISTKLTHKT